MRTGLFTLNTKSTGQWIIDIKQVYTGIQTMKKMLNILLIVGGGYIAIVLLLYLMQSNMIFIPDRHLVENPSAFGMQWEDAWMETSDGKEIHGWYIPAENSEQIVLLSHGNAGNISHRLTFIEMLHKNEISAFIYDYRGYGKSEGSPSEQGLYRDIRAAWEYLVGEKAYRESDIYLLGRSLGGPVSSHLAQEVNPGGLILESTFTSARDVASDIYPFVPSSLVRFKFATIEHLENIDVPVLIMHSRGDHIINYRHGERLFDGASEPREFIELQGGHNDNFMVSEEIYTRALLRFLGREN